MKNLNDTEIINWIYTPIGAVITCIITLILIGSIAFAYACIKASEEMINDSKTILKKINK